MKSGDHVYVDRGFYTHHGIYISNKEVIHFNGHPGQDNQDSQICYTSPRAFADGGVVQIKDYGPRLNHRVTVKRAKGLLGKSDYDLIDHNCEHFATWCVTGNSVSEQVGWAFGMLSVGALAVAALAAPIALPEMLALGAVAMVTRNVVSDRSKQGRDFVPQVSPVPLMTPSQRSQMISQVSRQLNAAQGRRTAKAEVEVETAKAPVEVGTAKASEQRNQIDLRHWIADLERRISVQTKANDKAFASQKFRATPPKWRLEEIRERHSYINDLEIDRLEYLGYVKGVFSRDQLAEIADQRGARVRLLESREAEAPGMYVSNWKTDAGEWLEFEAKIISLSHFIPHLSKEHRAVPSNSGSQR